MMLEDAPADASPFYQALARSKLAALAVSAADTVRFHGPDRRRTHQLEQRAAFIGIAKDQLTQVIELDQVAHTLPTLGSVARAHEQLAEAMLAEPPVRRLSASQQTLYDQNMNEKAVSLLIKALRYYTKAIEYAGSQGWTGGALPELEQGAKRVAARVEVLDP
jgi:hypothetical protein